MTVEVNTSKFVAAHGTEPKGRGSWAFVQEASHGQEEHVFFAPAWMTFTEARAWVKKQVRANGFQDATVHVGS
jgi:hypothetical protein